MNRLLKLTSIIEATTGLALIAIPSVVVDLLLRAEISGASIALGRVGGFGLLSLGLACWPDRDAAIAAAPAFRAILTYNLLATLYLAHLGIRGGRIGILLWPAVAAHGVLTLMLGSAWIANRRTKEASGTRTPNGEIRREQ